MAQVASQPLSPSEGLAPLALCILVALVPLALRGVRYRPMGAEGLLRRNLLIYGLGGILAPFLGIKLIDLLLALVRFP